MITYYCSHNFKELDYDIWTLVRLLQHPLTLRA